ncbi:MAG: bifunctional ornithine acetyltransferase/N-acetylglutamate synthase, partial [Actinobacteria bacterium]|nr:bifunctional ornithine acetyltransferase/N-acetylglutamate synthase [Actinomycetota bacterium]
AARVIARSALLKCAIHGEDANWGRVLAALGTSDAVFNPDMVDVALNGVWVCRGGQAAESRDAVRWEGRAVTIDVLLHAGECASTVWTNDLTAMYVHENSAYSS